MQKNLIYIHTGTLPKFLIDSLFQVILVNTKSKYKQSADIHVLLNKSEIIAFKNLIKDVNWDLYNLNPDITVFPIEDLNIDYIYKNDSNLKNFREGFWLHTTSRFLIIEQYMILKNLSLVFHIENDVMMYKSFDSIYKQNLNNSNSIWVVKDSPNRVIPSIVFFPNISSSKRLVAFIRKTIETSGSNFMNDMNILGVYDDVYLLPIKNDKCIYDGAAIGQYLGGIDARNVDKTLEYSDSMQVYMSTMGFVNETSEFNPSGFIHSSKRVHTGVNNIDIPVITSGSHIKVKSTVANLHIHSKNLAMFSSLNCTKYNDIITGDRVIDLCDFVITTRSIYDFHKLQNRDESKFIIIKDFANINVDKFYNILSGIRTSVIKIFVYTHLLEAFQHYLLPSVPDNCNLVLYTGNSDHVFDYTYRRILDSDRISHVYAQNLNIKSDKCSILPIGIANQMWAHGDTLALYQVILEVYNKVKPGSMYVNINTSTFQYRQNILDACILKGFKQSKSKPYIEYLRELATFKFCLCIRGNGIDTHRFWESLYLGVIPVIINNEYTDCAEFVENLNNLGIPFYEIKHLDQLGPRNFTFKNYKKLITEHGTSIQNTNALSLQFFAI